jgi:pimeloyl-ACP methyl ester carboxylesterase/quercetin dioxygenase-like cupin family protein
VVPHAHGKVPCVVLVPGSLSQTRDGGMSRAGVPSRDALKRLADVLAESGYASLRYDKPPHGKSKTTAKWTGRYADEAAVAAAAIRYARTRPEIGKVVAAGESAGAYAACLAAKDGTRADAYLFLGALCGPSEELYEYTFGGLVKYAASSPERRAWAEKHHRHELALGRHSREMLKAAAAGKNTFEVVDGDYRARMDLARRQEELRWPPDEMFRHIKAPALALAGEKDLNVPPRHAARVAEIMGQAGNMEAVSAVIPGADHSFQQAPADEDERYRERYSFASFRRPYEPRLYQEVLAWLRRTVPTPATGGAVAARTVPPGLNERARDRTEVDPKTENTPQRIQLAPGVEIIDDITDRAKTAAVETLEGRIGPLLLAEGAQAHFIDMPAGMYVEEHPHKTESIIYTVKGRWVLCSKGRRHLMKPGSLFRFGRDIPTGYEVPFPENAFILIFKGDRTLKHEKEFIDYLKGMAERLKKEQKEGVPYLLKDLPADHAARKFARQVNPEFEK